MGRGSSLWNVKLLLVRKLFAVALCASFVLTPLEIAFRNNCGIITNVGVSVISSIGLPLFGVSINNPYLYSWSLIFGLVAIAAGGYVTSVNSSSSKEFNVVVFVVVKLLIGLLISAFVAIPLWFNVESSLLTIPAGLLGGYVVTLRR